MGLQHNMINEPISRLALREPVICTADETLRTAIERMRAQQLGCAIIVDAERTPIGMFTEGMLTQILSQHSTVPLDDPLGDHMAKQWPWVKQSDPIADVLDALQTKNVRFICVVDDAGHVAALAGQKGLMEYVAEHFPGQVMVQRVGFAPSEDREGA